MGVQKVGKKLGSAVNCMDGDKICSPEITDEHTFVHVLYVNKSVKMSTHKPVP